MKMLHWFVILLVASVWQSGLATQLTVSGPNWNYETRIRISTKIETSQVQSQWLYTSFHWNFKSAFYDHCSQCQTTFTREGYTYNTIGCELKDYYIRNYDEENFRFVQGGECKVIQNFAMINGDLHWKQGSTTLGLGDFVFGYPPNREYEASHDYGNEVTFTQRLYTPYYTERLPLLMWLESSPRSSSTYTQVGSGSFYVITFNGWTAPTKSPTPNPTTKKPTASPTTKSPTNSPTLPTPAPTPAPTHEAGLRQLGVNHGLVNLGTNFECNFGIKVLDVRSDWRNLFRVGSPSASTQRVPLVAIYPGSTRLHVRASTSANWNAGCDPWEHLPVNELVNVKFKVSEEVLTVYFNGVEKQQCNLGGVVRDFGLQPMIESSSPGILIRDPVCSDSTPQPIRNNLQIGSLSLGEQYRCDFDITPKGKLSGWQRVFQVGNQWDQRAPGVWFYPDSTRLHIRFSTLSNFNEGCDLDNELPLNQEARISIRLSWSLQRTSTWSFTMKKIWRVHVFQDGIVKKNCQLPDAPKLFGTLPFMEGGAPNADIRNLRCNPM